MLSGRSLLTSGLPGRRLLEVHHRRERLVVNDHKLRSVVCKVAILGNDHGHRLAGVSRLGRRNRELLGNLLLVGDKGVRDRKRSADHRLEVGGDEHRNHALGR